MLLPALLLALSASGAERYARWEWYDPAAVKYLTEARIGSVIVAGEIAPDFLKACHSAGIQVLRSAPAGVQWVTDGKWPGLDPHVQTKPGAEGATTAATGDPWLDSNSWLAAYHRAMSAQPVLLSFDPPKEARLRPGSVELAVADAAVFGAQFAIKLDERFRTGLLSAQPRAVAEWKRVARQLDFVGTPPFRGTPAGNIAIVADKLEPVAEVMNLLARRHLPFVVVPASEAAPARLETFALVISVGRPPLRVKGPVLVERSEVADPHAFADEVRKLLGDRRLYTLTNAETVISWPLRLDDGRLALHLVNYAIDPVRDVRLRLPAGGRFSRAQLLAPERGAPLDLTVQGGEIALPELRISAVILLSQ